MLQTTASLPVSLEFLGDQPRLSESKHARRARFHQSWYRAARLGINGWGQTPWASLNQAIFNNLYVANDDVIGDDVKQPLRELLAAQRGWAAYDADLPLSAAQASAQAELARYIGEQPKETAHTGGLLGSNQSGLTDALLAGIYQDGDSSKTLMVDLRGFEPLTPCMPCRCATNCATGPSASPDQPGQLEKNTTRIAASTNRRSSPGRVAPRPARRF